LGRIFAPHTSHEGNWCQASIGLRHGTCCRLIWGLRASPRLFFSQSISITYRCRPCGVVGDALASSKRSGKSTGFCWPPTPPLARQCVLAALHADNLRGARHWAHLHAANGCTVKDRHLPRRRSVVESVARAQATEERMDLILIII